MIKELIQTKIFSFKWKKLNRHNMTAPANTFDPALVTVGKKTYGRLEVLMYNNTSRLSIGSFCSIAPKVIFMLSADHYVDHISTYPFKAKITEPGSSEGYSKGDIIVGDDVWIGYGVTVLSGVHIGQGAVVAAGAVVTSDIPPYAIAGGIPAKVIKYRFDNEMIDKLMKVDYSLLDDETVKKHIDELYRPAVNCESLEWLPKRCASSLKE